MATTTGGQPILVAVPPPPPNLKTPYATILNSKSKDKDTTIYETFDVPIKPPKNINGRYTISWSKKEIQQSILQTNLQYAIMGKFKYGNPDIHELRKVIPSQCGIKGECVIGLLENKVILIRCIDREDYINLLSTTGFWLTLKNGSIHMRTLKWDIWQDVKKEPPIAMAWISLPNLPPNFFAEDFVKSIALAVGKPMQVDLATKTNSRPSCARVKVEVNLLGDLPEVVEVGEHDEDENVIFSKWIKIRYDYLPKYCKTCCLQGHDEQECYSLHPQLYPRKNMEDKQKNVGVCNQKHSENKEDNLVIDNGKNPVQTTKGNTIVTTTEPHNIFSTGRLVFNNQPHEEWQQGRKKKHGVSHSLDQTVQFWKTNDSKEDKGQKAGLHRVSNVNTFTVLNNEEDEHIQEMDKEGGEVQLLQASENAMQDNNETVMGTINQSTKGAHQGINSRNEEKDSQHELESLENFEVLDHVLSGDKIAQDRRAHVGNSLKDDAQNTRADAGDFLKKDDIIILRGHVSNKVGTTLATVNNVSSVHKASQQSATPSQSATPKEKDSGDHRICEVGPCVDTAKNIHARSTNSRNIAKESVDNVVKALTQLHHESPENTTAYNVPPLSHRSNALIPTQELELRFKLERLWKLHGTNLVTLEIAKKLTKQEQLLFLQIMKEHQCDSPKGETTTTFNASATGKNSSQGK